MRCPNAEASNAAASAVRRSKGPLRLSPSYSRQASQLLQSAVCFTVFIVMPSSRFTTSTDLRASLWVENIQRQIIHALVWYSAPPSATIVRKQTKTRSGAQPKRFFASVATLQTQQTHACRVHPRQKPPSSTKKKVEASKAPHYTTLYEYNVLFVLGASSALTLNLNEAKKEPDLYKGTLSWVVDVSITPLESLYQFGRYSAIILWYYCLFDCCTDTIDGDRRVECDRFSTDGLANSAPSILYYYYSSINRLYCWLKK